MARGGKREGSGRKKRSDEQKLVERLGLFEEEAMNALQDAVEKKKQWAIKLYMNYMYGMPKQIQDVKVEGDISISKLLDTLDGKT